MVQWILSVPLGLFDKDQSSVHCGGGKQAHVHRHMCIPDCGGHRID